MTGAHIWYFVHDVTDPAVTRRVEMLSAAGAHLTILGFRRSDKPVDNLAGYNVIDLGRTYNGQFLHRVMHIIKHCLTLKKILPAIDTPTIIIARNLEMLALAVSARRRLRRMQPVPNLIYESLDIHRLLLRKDIFGHALRMLEGHLSKRAQLLITSSPAFLREYFIPRSRVQLPALLIHNRVHLHQMPERTRTARPDGPPWIIGWCGAIRCKASLKLLDQATRLADGAIKVELHGKPALDQFDDFFEVINNNPHMHFAGAYKYEDLPDIYSKVHFSWVIDRFEMNQNSSWLLPNRLYEGCLYGAVPIAEPHVEVGRTLTHKGIGMLLKDWSAETLAQQLTQLTPERYAQHADAVYQQPVGKWVYTDDDCQRLLHHLQQPIKLADTKLLEL